MWIVRKRWVLSFWDWNPNTRRTLYSHTQNLSNLVFFKEWKEWVGIGGIRNEEINGVTIMPCLQDLTISRCPKLKVLPYFFCTTPLKKLDIFQCPILGERCQKGDRRGLVQDLSYPKHQN